MNQFWVRCGAVGQILLSLFALAAAVVLLGFAARYLPASLRTPVAALGMWGAVAAGAAMLRLSRTSYRAIGFASPESWPRTFGWAALATALVILGGFGVSALLTNAFDWAPPNAAYVSSSITRDPLAYATWIVLVVWGSAAFGEELLFRGFILDRLQVACGRGSVGLGCAIVLQAVLFGVMHGVQGPTGIVMTAYAGLVLAGAWLASGRNLWASILAHGAVDTILLTLLFLGVPLPGYQA